MATRHCQCGCGKTFEVCFGENITRRFYSVEHSRAYHNRKKKESRERENEVRVCLGCKLPIIRTKTEKQLKYHNDSCKNRYYREQSKSVDSDVVRRRGTRIDKQLLKARRIELDALSLTSREYKTKDIITDQISRLRFNMAKLTDLTDLMIYTERISILELALEKLLRRPE